MGFPSYVNSTYHSDNAATSSTGSLPGSRVNGNLLLAVIHLNKGATTFTVSGAWSAVTGDSSANASVGYAWIYVDGTETLPVFSWSGASSYDFQVHQFTGVHATTPIGNTNSAHAVSDATLTLASITTTADNSLILWLAFDAGPLYPSTTLTYTEVIAGSGGGNAGRELLLTGQVPISGQSSTADSLTLPSATNWNSFGIELLGTGVGVQSAIRSTQVTLDVPYDYSTPATIAHTTQVTIQIPELYSTPVMAARTTQITLMVLRSEAVAITADLTDTLMTADAYTVPPAAAPPEIHRKIRDPWDCDEWGRFQPGSCIRPIY